jgi:uncharacterized cupin superfamily protein
MPDKAIIRLSPQPEGFGDKPDQLAAEMFASALPVQHSHEYYEDEDLGLYVGVWDTTDMIEAAGRYGADEFMWVLEGEAAIKNNKTGEMETAQAGEAFVIPRGYDCQWHQVGYLRKFYMISENPNEEIPAQAALEGIAVARADAKLEPMVASEPFALTGDAVQKAHNCYEDTTGKFLCGTWECDAFESESRPFPHYEFAYVQEGSMTLTDESGKTHVFAAGDAFFVPQGLVCFGQSADGVRLFYAVLRTAPGSRI